MLCALISQTALREKSGKSVFGVLATEQSLDGLLRNERRSRFEFEVLRVLSQNRMILLRHAANGSHPLKSTTEDISLRGDRKPFDERGGLRLVGSRSPVSRPPSS